MNTRSKKRVLVGLLAALVGVVLFQVLRPPVPVDLRDAELDFFSQSGEDGVVRRLFELIEPTSRFVVDFGCSDGVKNSNSRYLITTQGWSGLLMDGSHRLIETARRAYQDYPKAKVVEAWVYPGNVETLFEQNGVPRDLDLLSIDIDSNDYYVWKVIHDYRPKVVIIEFNPAFPPPQKAVVQFHPLNYWEEGSNYYGASIQSLYELGKQKGYELVHCTSAGLNLFFVEEKYFARLGIRDNSPAALYRPGLPGSPRYGQGGGHKPWDTYEIEKEGTRIKPFASDLIWQEIRIPKKLVALP